MVRGNLALSFQSGDQQRSFAREVEGALEIALFQSATRLSEKGARILKRFAVGIGQIRRLESGESLADVFLQALDLASHRGFLC